MTERNIFYPQSEVGKTLAYMYVQMQTLGCSDPQPLPHDKNLASQYRQLGIKPTRDLVTTYDPNVVIPDVIEDIIPGANITIIKRTFLPGVSEGEHVDPYDAVVTLTEHGSADFSLIGHVGHRLKSSHLIMFDPRNPHEVSAPLDGRHRLITAFAIKYS